MTPARRAALPALAVLLVVLLGGLSAPPPSPRPGAGTGTGAPGGERIAVAVAPAAVDWPEGPVSLLSALALRSGDRRFGGLSGLLVSADGAAAVLVSDRGTLFRAALDRRAGALSGLGAVEAFALRDTTGEPVAGADRDAEGLAAWPDGGLLVSFEGHHRLWRYPAAGGAARRVAAPDAVPRLPVNGGVEALATEASGAVFAVPETPPGGGAFPVWRRDPASGEWTEGRWPLRGAFRPTGADIGPDGRLYLLERDFGWLGGWSMRLSRADLASWPDLAPQTLVTVRQGGIDNMEGVAVWRDGAGRLRALLVSDDNFHPLQRTLLLELALPD